MTRCKQCHLDGHHKMSCTDESNPARKDRVTVPTSLKEPIVEGAYYLREDGQVLGPAAREPLLRDVFPLWRVGLHLFTDNGTSADTIQACGPRLIHRVYLVPVDPAEVVAELRGLKAQAELASDPDGEALNYERCDGRADAFAEAADLVAEKLGVEL